MRPFLIFISLFSSIIVFAQAPNVMLKGVVLEQGSNLSVPYATVVIVDSISNKPITGTTTNEAGEFNIKTTSSEVYLQISFIGFKTLTFKNLDFSNAEYDLGTLKMEQDSQSLDEVLVRAEVSSTQFKLDRKIFNVGQDIASTGVSALEVLNNVPSVNVNIEGQVSLRGNSGVQILIDGKPSVLADESSNALGTITADMIDRIEVITNPSAKYEAEGTAGILNIILKKEDKKGLNGSVSLNTGIPDNYSIGMSLNRRTEKFNLFTQVGGGYRSLPRDNKSENTNFENKSSVISEGTEYRNETFFNITLGTDYHINDLNVLTLSGNYAYEIEDQPSQIDFSSYDDSVLNSKWFRDESTEGTNPKWQYELNYNKEFENNEEHTLLFSVLGNFFGKDQESEFTNTTTYGDIVNVNQQTETKFQQADYTFKLDYTNPISEKVTIETGVQYLINDVGNDYEVRDFESGNWVVDPLLTNNFEYNQKVLGFYGTGAYEADQWGVKLGLRVETTKLYTLLTNTDEENNQNYTDLFPTVHSSYKFNDDFSIQVGYSKRIFRPRLWDLNPFFNIKNNYNIRVGNPNLQPEYSNSYEITGIFKLGKVTLNSSLFYLYTTDVVEHVSVFQDNVTLTAPINVGTNGALGFELNGKYSPLDWLSFNGDFNFNYFKRKGAFEAQSFDFNGDRWNGRLTSKIRLPADFDFEITGQFQSDYQTVQGEDYGFAFADLGLRKKILKGKVVVNFAIKDVFESRIYESTILNANNYNYNSSTRGRFYTLGFSYGFGKGEAMTYSGSRR
ncbi:outer membrane beta-barrel family protein [Formosa sp. PL04]|uniref:outer membrane beta-barrel family protein n=1 Tax=Formosa sp. PL04 TaxID=3081755 RepID=UPI002982A3EB|nr:outer membrane beta-barrel family protein [Formosa sp. PL04]MDW5290404.1 outer membrane beta-barrel family protein [Formosa sp. PL04]